MKNARITKKGKSKANVASGTVVETLVITSSNIVQIVAEVSPFIYLLPFLLSFRASCCDSVYDVL